ESGANTRLRRIAVAQLLTYALVDQHVRVDGHTHRQHDACNAGQREHEDHQIADDGGLYASIDVVLAERRADRALLDGNDRRGQRAGAQQQREVASLEYTQARDLELVREYAVDARV